MKPKITYLLLATLLITNCIMLFMLVKKPHLSFNKPKKGSFLIEKLNLDKEQEKKFLILDEAHRNKMLPLDEEITENKKILFNSFSKSETINKEIITKIGELVGKKEVEVFDFFGKVKTLCNKEQVKKLEEIIEMALEQHSGEKGGMPPGAGMPPPRN